jgi:hypothetical protein
MDSLMISAEDVKARFYQQWEANKEMGPACSATLFEMVNQDDLDRVDLFCYYLIGRTMGAPEIDSAWVVVQPEVEFCIENMKRNGVPEAAEALRFYRNVMNESEI